jgi:hypothetical protein
VADAVHKKRGPKPRQDALMQRPTVARLSDNDVWGNLVSLPPLFARCTHIYLLMPRKYWGMTLAEQRYYHLNGQ